jgi:hypothetical protein
MTATTLDKCQQRRALGGSVILRLIRALVIFTILCAIRKARRDAVHHPRLRRRQHYHVNSDTYAPAVFLKSGTSPEVIELGRQWAREANVRPLASDERPPCGYYTANHLTGKSDIADDNASERR